MNWLVVSMTILPASDPAVANAASTADQGTEIMRTGPKVAASAAVPTRARSPSSAASAGRVSGSREKLTSTSCPARVNIRAVLPPIRPAPIIPIFTMVSLLSDNILACS